MSLPEPSAPAFDRSPEYKRARSGTHPSRTPPRAGVAGSGKLLESRWQPLPKKGDASLCSNHSTIALQSIAGKAFDSVDMKMACQILLSRGAPQSLLLLSGTSTHITQHVRSQVDSTSIDIGVGFKQGCVLAPPLFNI
ncbi:TPA: hypothetical protein ACH3X1_006975 [Trebouxia sp. C0004]